MNRSGPERLGAIIADYLDTSGIARAVSEDDATRAWRLAAGESTAKRTKVTALKRGVLHVNVESAALFQELTCFRKNTLIDQLAALEDAPKIVNIRFNLGAISDSSRGANS